MKKLLVLTALLGVMVAPAAAVPIDNFNTRTAGDLINNQNALEGDDWRTRNGEVEFASIGTTASMALRLEDNGADGASAEGNCGKWFQMSALGIGAGTYQLKFDYIVVSGGQSVADMEITIAENNGSIGGNDNRIGMSGGGTHAVKGLTTSDLNDVSVFTNSSDVADWTSFTSGNFTLDAADTWVYIGFTGRDLGETDGHYIGIDNIEIVPEPATMSLLALGGIGMLIRRKRRA